VTVVLAPLFLGANEGVVLIAWDRRHPAGMQRTWDRRHPAGMQRAWDRRLPAGMQRTWDRRLPAGICFKSCDRVKVVLAPLLL